MNSNLVAVRIPKDVFYAKRVSSMSLCVSAQHRIAYCISQLASDVWVEDVACPSQKRTRRDFLRRAAELSDWVEVLTTAVYCMAVELYVKAKQPVLKLVKLSEYFLVVFGLWQGRRDSALLDVVPYHMACAVWTKR